MKGDAVILTIALTLIGGLFVGQDSAEEIWGRAQVESYISANAAAPNALSSDPFELPPAQAAPAKNVRLDYAVKGPNETDTGLGLNPIHWRYLPQTQTMTVEIRPGGFSGMLQLDFEGRPHTTLPDGYMTRVRQGWLTSFKAQNVRSGQGTNAYGASREITSGTLVMSGIGELGSRFADAGPRGGSGEVTGYVYAFTIEPDAGRELAPRLRVRINAETVPWAPNRYVICGHQSDRSTWSSPVSSNLSGCFLTTRVNSIQIVDDLERKILKEWVR